MLIAVKKIMEKINTTWITTNTRTGSHWTTNIVKEILREAKINVLPTKSSDCLLRTKEDLIAVYNQQACHDRSENNYYVLPVHTIIKYNLPRCKYITIIRNPFDVCASIYQFLNLRAQNIDLEYAIEAAMGLPKFKSYYSRLNKEKCLILNFEHIDEQPENLIKKISKFHGICLEDSIVERLAKRYSRESIIKIINNNDKILLDKLLNKKKINKEEIIIRIKRL